LTVLPQTTDIEYIGCWSEVEGYEGEKRYKFRPLLDALSISIAIKNTGTSLIDHFTFRQTASIAHLKLDLLHPRIPAHLWKPFAGNLLTSSFFRLITVKPDGLEVTNPVSGRSVEATSLSPIGNRGIDPGETFTIVEKKKPYVEFILEGMENKGAEMKADLRMEILDREMGIWDMVIKEYKLGPIAFHNMRLQIVMKGTVKTLQEVSIDGKRLDYKEVKIEYL
jgi:hypothetical protein